MLIIIKDMIAKFFSFSIRVIFSNVVALHLEYYEDSHRNVFFYNLCDVILFNFFFLPLNVSLVD